LFYGISLFDRASDEKLEDFMTRAMYKTQNEINQRVKQAAKWFPSVPEGISGFILSLLQVDPGRRPTIQQVKKDFDAIMRAQKLGLEVKAASKSEIVTESKVEVSCLPCTIL
jgi:hypothetical protein